MARYALVNEQGEIENVADWDGDTPWPLGDAAGLLPDDVAGGPGDHYDGKTFSRFEPAVDDVAAAAAEAVAEAQGIDSALATIAADPVLSAETKSAIALVVDSLRPKPSLLNRMLGRS